MPTVMNDNVYNALANDHPAGSGGGLTVLSIAPEIFLDRVDLPEPLARAHGAQHGGADR